MLQSDFFLYNALSEGILVFDRLRQITFANKAFYALAQLESGEVVSSLDQVFQDFPSNEALASFPDSFEIRLRQQPHKNRFVEITVVVPSESNGLYKAIVKPIAAKVDLPYLLDQLLQQRHLGLWVIDEKYATVLVNDLLAQWLSFSPIEMETLNFLDLLQKPAKEKTVSFLAEKNLANAQVVKIATKSGLFKSFTIRKSFLTKGEHQQNGTALFLEEATNQSLSVLFEHNYQELINQIGVGIVIHAPDTSVKFSNTAAENMLGLTHDQLLGKVAFDPYWHFIWPDKTVMQLNEYPVNQVIASEMPLNNYRLGVVKTNTAEVLWLLINGYPSFNDQEELAEVVITFIDISQEVKFGRLLENTDQQLAHFSLRLDQENAFLKTLFASIPDPVFYKDADGRYILCNQPFADFLELSIDDIIGKTDEDIVPSNRAEGFRYSDQQVLLLGQSQHSAEWLLATSGKKVYLDTLKTPVRDLEGEIIGLIGISRDITEIQMATVTINVVTHIQEVLIMEDDLNTAIKQVLEILVDTLEADRAYIFKHSTEDGTVSQLYEYVLGAVSFQIDNPQLQNASYEELGFGRWQKLLSQNQLVKGNVADFPEEEQELLRSQDIKSILVAPIFVKNDLYGFIGIDNCKSSYLWGLSEEFLLRSSAGSLGYSIDRSHSLKLMLENNLKLTKANTELDNLVYRVSHDLRSPVSSSLGLIDLIKQTEELAEIRQYLAMQELRLTRLDQLIVDILTYSHNSRAAIQREVIPFKKMLEALQENYAHLSAQQLQHVVEIEGEEHFFYSDPVRIEGILNSVYSNAIKFTHHYRHVSVVGIKVEITSQHAIITISDNGEGISEEHLPHVFKMFYRGSESKKGSGLGLYIAKESVEKLGGTIAIHSQLNHGTTIEITLPNLW